MANVLPRRRPILFMRFLCMRICEYFVYKVARKTHNNNWMMIRSTLRVDVIVQKIYSRIILYVTRTFRANDSELLIFLVWEIRNCTVLRDKLNSHIYRYVIIDRNIIFGITAFKKAHTLKFYSRKLLMGVFDDKKSYYNDSFSKFFFIIFTDQYNFMLHTYT